MPARILHIWSNWARKKPGDQRRHADARASWHRAYGTVGDCSGRWLNVAVDEKDMPRNAKTVLGDPFPLPFVIDIIDMGIEQAKGQPNEYVCWSNDDTNFVEDIANHLCEAKLGWASRRDFLSVPRRVTRESVVKGHKHEGCDLTFFSVAQWAGIRKKLPDMVLAREQFDLIWKDVIARMGGNEIKDVIAHAMHSTYWLAHSSDPSAMHNKALSEQYRVDNGMKKHW